MLSLLNISNVALIDDLRVEFDRGLNLLTGETGSGKSIIVDALGVLIGGRFSAEMIKAGETRSSIEGLFSIENHPEMNELLAEAGIELEHAEEGEVLVRRELTTGGRAKIFINHQLATLSLLRNLRPFLVDICGQGEQQSLFDPYKHLELLDAYAGAGALRQRVASIYQSFASINRELAELGRDEAAKFQTIDILRFQIGELEEAQLERGEEGRLEEERRRLNNLEKLTTLCSEAYNQTYEENDSAIARVGQATKRVEELAEYESDFRGYLEGLRSARATLEDLAFTLRSFAEKLEFSPTRLAQIEDRLAEVARLRRKYGGTVESALEHLERSKERLQLIERSDQREEELRGRLKATQDEYLLAARKIHAARKKAAAKFNHEIECNLREVAMGHASFEARITTASETAFAEHRSSQHFTTRGLDMVEFYFSANPGEPLKPLVRVASGGEASRLMLVLKTIVNPTEFPRTIVFDEIDTGIGGRVAEAVGIKLKSLARTNQVLCVTHQPQIARFADSHLLINKSVNMGHTEVRIEKLDNRTRVEEIARMLTGSNITETARRHAREMLKTITIS